MAKTRSETPRRRGLHPTQIVVGSFGTAIAIGTLLLWTPWAKTGPGNASFVDALFTATSATCVTGLAVQPTGEYWSGFGEVVILVLFQIGGLGIMTLASLLGLLVARRLGLKSRLTAQAETKAVGVGDVRSVIHGVVRVTVIFELIVWIILTVRLATKYDDSWAHATYDGLFHAVSAFNNAGLSLNTDSLESYVNDPWVTLPISLAVLAGSLGFPVWLELARRYRRPDQWGVHTTMTLSAIFGLLIIGFVFITANEWRNPATMGNLDVWSRLLNGFVHSVMPRSGGLNTLDVGAMNDSTLLGTIVLMFIGGGSASTAGGIKVTTFMLLFWVIWAEARGQKDVVVAKRRIEERAIRQALVIALLSIAAVVGSTLVLMELTEFALIDVLFEATSAFAVCGLSTGITPDLPDAGKLLLVGLMFAGRLGPITLVSALALRERADMYRHPEGRPIIG